MDRGASDRMVKAPIAHTHVTGRPNMRRKSGSAFLDRAKFRGRSVDAALRKTASAQPDATQYGHAAAPMRRNVPNSCTSHIVPARLSMPNHHSYAVSLSRAAPDAFCRLDLNAHMARNHASHGYSRGTPATRRDPVGANPSSIIALKTTIADAPDSTATVTTRS